jgi:hypothetical protein
MKLRVEENKFPLSSVTFYPSLNSREVKIPASHQTGSNAYTDSEATHLDGGFVAFLLPFSNIS